jgi:hypothetical protein
VTRHLTGCLVALAGRRGAVTAFLITVVCSFSSFEDKIRDEKEDQSLSL